jgi:hypothetical protein
VPLSTFKVIIIISFEDTDNDRGKRSSWAVGAIHVPIDENNERTTINLDD